MTQPKGNDNLSRRVGSPAELTRRRDLALNIAAEAGALALEMRAKGVALAGHKSSLADIVTEADQAVEELIRNRILAEFPEDGILGEEGGVLNDGASLCWVVDPIDGTVNYASGFAQYAVSIAVVSGGITPLDWQEEIGVVSAPALGETFSAVRGGGAYLGRQRLTINEGIPDAGALIATGFGYDPATHAGDLARVKRVMPIARDIRRMGAASLDLANLAAGRLDVYFERGLQPWDMAAGALLVTEAGGVVVGIDCNRPSNKMLVSGNATMVAAVLNLISE